MKKTLLIASLIFIGWCTHAQSFESGMIAATPGSTDKNGVYYYAGVDEKPDFPDKQNTFTKHIAENISLEPYKSTGAKYLEIELTFIIEKNGSVSEAEVINHPPPAAVNEALGAIKNLKPKWTPGKYEGKPVRTGMYYRIVINISTRKTITSEPVVEVAQASQYGPGDSPENRVEIPGIDNAIYNASGLQVQPEFPGGTSALTNFINANIKKDNLPEAKVFKELKVYVTFIVEKDGYMTGIKLLREPGYGIGKETVRVLKLVKTKWSPGIQNGKPVRAQYSLPILIKIPE
jgi:Gram-negative bacterial TonB protein C-terminal